MAQGVPQRQRLHCRARCQASPSRIPHRTFYYWTTSPSPVSGISPPFSYGTFNCWTTSLASSVMLSTPPTHPPQVSRSCWLKKKILCSDQKWTNSSHNLCLPDIIKNQCDRELQVITQCVKQPNVYKCSPPTVGNLLLKINAKLGGVDFISFYSETRGPTFSQVVRYRIP